MVRINDICSQDTYIIGHNFETLYFEFTLMGMSQKGSSVDKL